MVAVIPCVILAFANKVIRMIAPKKEDTLSHASESDRFFSLSRLSLNCSALSLKIFSILLISGLNAALDKIMGIKNQSYHSGVFMFKHRHHSLHFYKKHQLISMQTREFIGICFFFLSSTLLKS